MELLYFDLKELIISYLENYDKFALRQTCKMFLKQCNNTIKKLTFHFDDFTMESTINMHFLSSFPNLTNLTIHHESKKKLNLIDFPSDICVKNLWLYGISLRGREYLAFQKLERICISGLSSANVFNWIIKLPELKQIILDRVPIFKKKSIQNNKMIIDMLLQMKNLESINFNLSFHEQNEADYFRIIQGLIEQKIKFKDLCLHNILSNVDKCDQSFFENVQVLTLSDNFIRDFWYRSGNTRDHIKELSKMTNLKSLDICYDTYSSEKLDCPPPSLEHLKIKFFPSYVSPSLFHPLKNLKSLSFEFCLSSSLQFFSIDISPYLEYLTNLEKLNTGEMDIRNHQVFKNLKKLKKLSMGYYNTEMNPIFEKENGNWENLKSFKLDFSEIDYVFDISVLKNMINLKTLDLNVTHEKEDPKRFQYFPKLKKLKIGKLTESDIHQLDEIKCRLEMLVMHFSETSLESNFQDLNSLKPFYDSLTHLSISVQLSTQIDIQMQDLIKFKNLQYFYCYSKKLTDDFKKYKQNQKRIEIKKRFALPISLKRKK